MIIGSGFAGLSAACFMAKAGMHVTVLEKHATAGGRARELNAGGFSFDMGPSWYWMPDVFERFFNCFGKKVEDYYTLQRLNPSYRIYWPDDFTDVPADYNALQELFERTEPGSANKLDKFLSDAAYKYKIAMQKLAYKPGQSFIEFLQWNIIKGIFSLNIFNSIKSHTAQYFKDSRLRQLMEFPLLFLGALPQKIPALYSFMNYADIKGGTWYPGAGMHSIVKAMQQLALELGVEFYFNENVTEIVIENKTAQKVISQTVNCQLPTANYFPADVVISAADYHYTENILPPQYRSYSESYWDKRAMAPGCLLYYVGVKKKLKNLLHHSLFFDASFETHGRQIYETKEWPANPLFYVCAPSVTDSAAAPANCENLFFLIPIAAGIQGDCEEIREKYFELIVSRFENRLGEKIKNDIVYKKSFSHNDFVSEYNSFKGNAYGLANTLWQTAIFKPRCRSKKVRNLFYAGQLTVPGPGVPPCIISGEIAATQALNLF